MKRFNVTGICVANKHYMVDITNKVNQIKEMVDKGQYFTINRARQYGKTTMLSFLQKRLQDEYTVIRMSFEGVGETMFKTEENFCIAFMELVQDSLEYTSSQKSYINDWLDVSANTFKLLSKHITKMCKEKKIVLLIDEVDKTSNNQVFLQFLGVLRDKFLRREEDIGFTFHSVILVGVYDIKNIKLKTINEGAHTNTVTEGKIYNSPWNIAVNFKIDMSFNSSEIATMLVQYEKDHSTCMNIPKISDEIYKYTNGYPFLVSRICQYIDEELNKDWSLNGVKNAVKILLREDNTLFDDLFKNLENNENLYNLIYDMLIIGEKKTFSNASPTIKLGLLYGIIREKNYNIEISNKVFELIICNYFISKDEEKPSNKLITGVLQYDIIHDGVFDMELCLRKFAQHYKEIFNTDNESDISFLERHGRIVFLSYLKPLINGQGFYHIESQFTDLRRMDIVVDFGRQQFVIKLKVWHGNVQHMNAYEQLVGYLDSKKLDIGYLLTFDLRKSMHKEKKAEWVEIEGKRIFDVIV